jgi:hypothetical protein
MDSVSSQVVAMFGVRGEEPRSTRKAGHGREMRKMRSASEQ